MWQCPCLPRTPTTNAKRLTPFYFKPVLREASSKINFRLWPRLQILPDQDCRIPYHRRTCSFPIRPPNWKTSSIACDPGKHMGLQVLLKPVLETCICLIWKHFSLVMAKFLFNIFASHLCKRQQNIPENNSTSVGAAATYKTSKNLNGMAVWVSAATTISCTVIKRYTGNIIKWSASAFSDSFEGKIHFRNTVPTRIWINLSSKFAGKCVWR